MRKRLSALALALLILFSMNTTVFACDEEQTAAYVTQVLFGDHYSAHDGDENVKLLLSALYICSEQCDNQGQKQLDFLEDKIPRQTPELENLNIKNEDLIECSHTSWEHECAQVLKIQNRRKELLRDTVREVFHFGTIDRIFRNGDHKANSFSALLYYTHILADYLADQPDGTKGGVNGGSVNSYAGTAYVEVNGNQPEFTPQQMGYGEYFSSYSSLDYLHRSGMAFLVAGEKTLQASDTKENLGMQYPPGWIQKKYDDLINAGYLYHRCHLIAHQLGGNESPENLMTGTSYLNESGMKPFENRVAAYIKRTGNHVLYRVTPVYAGENLVPSGVQIEAYSVEDMGEGICFNVYCYNIQPGIEINYDTGDNSKSDTLYNNPEALPFAVYKADEDTPDFIYEMNKHLAILFEDQVDTNTYISMMNDIETLAGKARNADSGGEKAAQRYKSLKEYEYEYFNILKSSVPHLLQKEHFFKAAFY